MENKEMGAEIKKNGNLPLSFFKKNGGAQSET